ncbi:MAG TPA: cytochrome P450 [Myxococcota bacterium]|nr:cytochrome P450 [Myxococcota bacterium]
MPDLESIDLTRHELFRRGFPHELFSILREEAPVWRHPATAGTAELGGAFWIVSRHADVQAVSRDHARFRSLEGPSLGGEKPERRGMMLISMDPPAHTRLRRLVSSGFTPRMTAKLETQAREWAIAILERALERGECNFVQEVAYPLPMHMIADIVGIPRSDRKPIFELVDAMLYALDPDSALPEEQQTAMLIELFGYGRDLAAEKRRAPSDDVWTRLTTAEIEQPDGSRTRLGELELDLFFMVLTVAGSETTRNAISAGLIALLEHPDQMERMRADPAVMSTAVDEILRWASPVSYFRRTAVEDVVVGGARIEAGHKVSLWYPSANRDREVHADPFRFDVGRTPNPHLAFGGGGVHYCLGANLAKQEVKVMFEELLARVGEIDLLGEPEYSVAGIKSPICFSLKNLPVRMKRR